MLGPPPDDGKMIRAVSWWVAAANPGRFTQPGSLREPTLPSMATVALLREPSSRPAGLPLRPGRKRPLGLRSASVNGWLLCFGLDELRTRRNGRDEVLTPIFNPSRITLPTPYGVVHRGRIIAITTRWPPRPIDRHDLVRLLSPAGEDRPLASAPRCVDPLPVDPHIFQGFTGPLQVLRRTPA